jgi:hypothetical protein
MNRILLDASRADREKSRLLEINAQSRGVVWFEGTINTTMQVA